jgi:hypothetical protein
MNIDKEEAKFLLEVILNAPVQTNVQGVINGVTATPMVIGLIEKLKAEQEDTSVITGEVTK